MKYVVECRSKDEEGNIQAIKFAGFGAGLADKRMANDVYEREKDSGKWDAVYIDKIYKNGVSITDKTWYKESL